MAKITRIKAGDPPADKEPKEPTPAPQPAGEPKKGQKQPKSTPQEAEIVQKSAKNDSKPAKTTAKPATTSEKPVKKGQKSTTKKPFILFRPFVALARYLRDSWREIRQVRWPDRKSTWQMFFAVLIYSALFILLITVLDIFFSWLFNLILGK